MSEPSRKGELYSHVYLERGAPVRDSSRARVRLGKFLDQFEYKICKSIGELFTGELGVEIPYATSHAEQLMKFFKSSDLLDVLNAVTLVHLYFMKQNWRSTAENWLTFVRRVFREENLAFVVDDAGGVHPLVDQEFARNIESAIGALAAKRYDGARTAFETAQANLEQSPADTKGAIRDMFEAAETLTKLLSGSGKALTAAFVKGEIEPRIQKIYFGDAVATMVGARMAQSFADWVDAAHPYRHGQKTESPVTPPEELAVLLVSQGASFLRWLADVDRRVDEMRR